MITEKIIEDDISLTTAELTSGDINSVIENKIRKKYERKCWQNVYVVKVKEIIKRNAIKMAIDRIDGQGNTNAQFRVEAIEFAHGDVLTGCRVIDIIKDSKIICEREDAIVTFRDRFFISPKPDQILFVRVKRASYLTNQNKANVYGSPYVIDSKKKIIHIPTGETSYAEDQKRLLSNVLKNVSIAQERIKKSKSTLVKFFEIMLYPYKDGSPADTPKKATPRGSTLIDIFDLAKDIASGKIKKQSKAALMSHPAVNMSTMKMYQLPESWNEKLMEGAKAEKEVRSKLQTYVIDKSHFDIILNVLYEHIVFLNTVADLCEIYADDSLRKKHNNIWESYERVKITL